MRISDSNFADIMGVSKKTIRLWEQNGTYVPQVDTEGHKYYLTENLVDLPEIREMVDSTCQEEMEIKPDRPYTSIELFAGAGGLALGMEKRYSIIYC